MEYNHRTLNEVTYTLIQDSFPTMFKESHDTALLFMDLPYSQQSMELAGYKDDLKDQMKNTPPDLDVLVGSIFKWFQKNSNKIPTIIIFASDETSIGYLSQMEDFWESLYKLFSTNKISVYFEKFQ